MHYRSLLFPGVLIAAIVSLLIVQLCTKNDQTESDRTGTKHDRELVNANAQALSYLQGDFATRPGRKGYYTTQQKLDRDQYLQNKSMLENWCKTGDRDACTLSLQIQYLEGPIMIDIPHDLIGK
jgi:hypothetical protein